MIDNSLIIDKQHYAEFISLCKILYYQYNGNTKLLNTGTMLISHDNKIFIIFNKNNKKHVIYIDGTYDILNALLQFKYIGDSYPYPDSNDKNMRNLDQYLAFKSLNNIFIDKNNISYNIIDNCLVDMQNNIIQATCNAHIISNKNVQIIQPKAYFALDITHIQITSNIKYIAHNAFFCCFLLENVNLPNSILEIGEDCFNQCVSLMHINIPTSTTKILKNTFRYCQSLEQLDIGQQVMQIDTAFKYCMKLKQLTNVNKYCVINDDILLEQDIIKYGNN